MVSPPGESVMPLNFDGSTAHAALSGLISAARALPCSLLSIGSTGTFANFGSATYRIKSA
jgi:hypothetical protein